MEANSEERIHWWRKDLSCIWLRSANGSSMSVHRNKQEQNEDFIENESAMFIDA